MNPPDREPNPQNLSQWRDFAIGFLRKQLGQDAPLQLGDATLLRDSPLEGEGPVCAFQFMLKRVGAEPHRCFVVVGRTEPNYYPVFDLTPDEVFSLHFGTRFMLVMGVAACDVASRSGYDAMADARRIVDRVAPKQPIDDLSVAAAFDVQGQIHVVLQCLLDGRRVYIMAGDAPQGFSQRTHLPPHVAYRLHLGEVLRREPAPNDDVP